MDQFAAVLLLSLLPAAGYVIGGLIAELFTVSGRTISFALHVTTGGIMSVISVELMPYLQRAELPWAFILAFVAGGIFFVLVDNTLRWLSRFYNSGGTASPYAIMAGVMIELLTDGVTIGTGVTVDLGLGVLLALAQLPANIPEAFTTIALFKKEGYSRERRIALSALFILPVIGGAIAGFALLRSQPELIKYLFLAFSAGALTTLVVEEIIPLAHRGPEDRLDALAFVIGFAAFTFISTYFRP